LVILKLPFGLDYTDVTRLGGLRSAPAAAGALLLTLTACAPAPTTGIARGKALFERCTPCHGDNGTGNRALGAPAIAGLPEWYVEGQLTDFRAGRRGYAPFDTNGIRMKSMSWTLQDSTDVAAVAMYVASLPAPTLTPVLHGNVAAGQATFQICAACHGPAARGNPDMHAPPLAGRSDWYLIRQLHDFHAGWRGGDTADVWGQVMKPNAMPLDDTMMVNVLSYIETLR